MILFPVLIAPAAETVDADSSDTFVRKWLSQKYTSIYDRSNPTISLTSEADAGNDTALKLLALHGHMAALQKLRALAANDAKTKAWLARMISDDTWTNDGLRVREFMRTRECPDEAEAILILNGDIESLNAIRGAKAQGDESYACLGFIHEGGFGVPQDYAAAARLYEVASNQPYNYMARINLGRLYFYGQGLPQNYAEAYYWLALGEYNGHLNHAPPSAADAYRHLDDMQKAAVYLGLSQLRDPNKAVFCGIIFAMGALLIRFGNRAFLRYSRLPGTYQFLLLLWTMATTLFSFGSQKYSEQLTSYTQLPLIIGDDLAILFSWFALWYLGSDKKGFFSQKISKAFENKKCLRTSQYMWLLVSLNTLGYLAGIIAEIFSRVVGNVLMTFV